MRCDQCGKEFRLNKPWQRFCKPECRDDYHNEQKRQLTEEMKRDAYADAVAAHEAKINGHSVEKKKVSLDVVRRKLLKPQPTLLRRMI